MVTEGWAQAVRRQLGLGRLLPLGGPADGAWLVERAAAEVLRHAARGLPGVEPGTVRVDLDDPAAAREPVVPAPPSALPPCPLRVEADFAVATGASPRQSLPELAEELRTVLLLAAREQLGLRAVAADLRVTALLDEEAPAEKASSKEAPAARQVAPVTAPSEEAWEAGQLGPSPARATAGDAAGSGAPEEALAATVTAVPGVAGLSSVLGGLGRPIRVSDSPGEAAALPRRHVLVQLAVAAGHRPLDVARAVRRAVSEAAAPGRPATVAVVVTDVPAGAARPPGTPTGPEAARSAEPEF
ncbi:nucleopolyhedrovirus P10 family protein [Streptomyces sp. URMC 123]|uniref:nucleopolyhedrovirus P10 family protein n=1 Tax=Streptomyces sp. URMC 123 TaxID=3423403 RepID=UPI003F197932